MMDPMQDQKTSGVMVLAAIAVFACALHLVPEIQAYMLPRWPVIDLGRLSVRVAGIAGGRSYFHEWLAAYWGWRKP